MLSLKMKNSKKIRNHFLILLIQILIIVLFVSMLSESLPIDSSDLVKTEVCVEKTSYIRYLSEYRFIIFSQSGRYSFANLGASAKYSNNELNEEISIGDCLSIMYYEKRNLFGKSNMVVDARTEEHIYRSIEEYNEGSDGISIFVIILFIIIEIVYLGCCLIYFWLEPKRKHKHRGRLA